MHNFSKTFWCSVSFACSELNSTIFDILRYSDGLRMVCAQKLNFIHIVQPQAPTTLP